MASPRRPTTTLVFVSLLCLYQAPRWAFSLSFSLDFSDLTAGTSILVAGDALISPPALQLTKNSWASYRYKVPLWNGATGEIASFATAFSFRITPEKEDSPNGMAFFLGHLPSLDVPRNSSGSAGGGTGESRIVAVEFDAFLNNVGIDVSSANSTAASAYATATWPGKNLTSSSVMEATGKYHNDTKLLAVGLLIGDALYQVNATVDLRRILMEEVAVGFSAANGAAAGLHRILSWSFSSSLPESKREAPPPAEPTLPTSSYSHRKVALVLLFIGTIAMRCVRIGFQAGFNPSPGHVTLGPDWDAAFLLPP
ncbi:hypothetical protein CFC21_111438 [Triticum aestivum]|uniref:Legume lectin domain-containing protein n=2 Tax=Triticum aestivum TaxID=4565 RepID=A0A9R1MQG4_WHEAT|nr:lectin 9-like [Aegilops tauschii subsp. strangulata]XP_044438699.1 lectin 9-like [Triticum aestivum]KAF7111424.1 hypothetical protein CFC21_111438 [Triticum aestivum]